MTHLRVGPLVRATSATSVVIWAEFFQACEITLSITALDAGKQDGASICTRTTTVGGRHYAAPQFDGLQPGTWYSYRLHIDEENASTRSDDTSSLIQCFRTMQPAGVDQADPLRIAYGSCRKLADARTDALSSFGPWLIQHFEQRETLWPHLLLLIGDQIYADQPSREMLQAHPQLRGGARTFEDFALLYEHAWTSDEGIRQVLAALPTYMIFDDHEITNNWNITPTWRAEAIQRGQEQLLIDGLVAYWVYQGWGNLSPRDASTHTLMRIMHEAEQSGEDALDALRECIKLEVYCKTDIRWHYGIPTMPPIFVANARADCPAVFTNNPDEVYAPARIMSQQQMAELQDWMHAHDTSISILVSSVPVLLPPLIGLAEYLMGVRLWRHTPLHWPGLLLARIQQRLAIGTSFDHWPVSTATWRELVQLLTERTNDMLVLSGDVHFSYAMEAHNSSSHASKPHLYQFVSTPLQNELGRRSRRMIVGQARITRITYGGLHTRMLPLHTADNTGRIQHDLLLRNVLALVTLQPQGESKYNVQQEYLGVVDGQMEVVGRTYMQSER